MTLRELGAEIAVGSLEDTSFLADAMQGVDAAFTMSTPFEDGLEAEIAQIRAGLGQGCVCDACGFSNEVGSRFCSACGQAVAAEAAR